MANYTKTTNFTAKDSFSSGDSRKIVRGSEHDTEYNNIATAIATKADAASPTLTGTATAVNLTVSGSLVASSGASMGSNKITSVANPTLAQDAATKAYVDAALPSTTGLLLNSNNLSDVSNTTTARTNLGLGSIATQAASAVAITGGSITGITDLAVADGGTGASTLSANAVLLGNGTSALQTVAPGTSGNVLTSNGTTWTSTAVSTAAGGIRGQFFYSSGSFTVPTGVTSIKMFVVGGGGGAGGQHLYPDEGEGASYQGGGTGGAAGYGQGYITVTPGTSLTVTIGTGGTGGGTNQAVSGTAGGNTSVSGGALTITGSGGSGGLSWNLVGVSGTGNGAAGTLTNGFYYPNFLGGGGGGSGGSNGSAGYVWLEW